MNIKDLKDKVYAFLDKNYYDYDEYTHITDALNSVTSGEDIAFQKRVLRKLVQEVKSSWQEDLRASYAEEPEAAATAKKVIREANQLLKDLQ